MRENHTQSPDPVSEMYWVMGGHEDDSEDTPITQLLEGYYTNLADAQKHATQLAQSRRTSYLVYRIRMLSQYVVADSQLDVTHFDEEV